MNVTYDKTKRKILAWSIEDTICLFFFSSIVNECFHYKDLELLKKATYDFIKDVQEKGLMQAGDLFPDNTFVAWHMPINEIIAKIKFKWDNLNRGLAPHELVWFEITEKGRKECEYLKSLPELNTGRPIYYLQMYKGGKKSADDMFAQMVPNAKLISTDKLKKLKIYKLDDDTYISYREDTKFHSSVIELHFTKSEKNVLLKF